VTLTLRFRFVVVRMSLVVGVIELRAAPVFVATNLLLYFVFIVGKMLMVGIIMTLCPSANVHYRHHSHDIFLKE
jgi:hypothetical protein